MEIRELKTDFIGTGEVKDFKFHQILSSDKGYIYEVKAFPNSQPHYEVFRRVLTYGITYDKENGKHVVDIKEKGIIMTPLCVFCFLGSCIWGLIGLIPFISYKIGKRHFDK